LTHKSLCSADAIIGPHEKEPVRERGSYYGLPTSAFRTSSDSALQYDPRLQYDPSFPSPSSVLQSTPEAPSAVAASLAQINEEAAAGPPGPPGVVAPRDDNRFLTCSICVRSFPFFLDPSEGEFVVSTDGEPRHDLADGLPWRRARVSDLTLRSFAEGET